MCYNKYAINYQFYVIEVFFMDSTIVRDEKKPQLLHSGTDFHTERFLSKEKFVSPHVHQFIELIYIKEGKLLVVSDNDRFTTNEGEMLLLRANSVHSIYPLSDNGCYYTLHLSLPYIMKLAYTEDGALYARYLSRFHPDNKVLWSAKELEGSRIADAFDSLCLAYGDKSLGHDIASRAHSLYILSFVLKNLSEQDNAEDITSDNSENISSKINEAILYINDHYSESLTVAEMAERLFMSYGYFSRNFKKVTGRSFKDFLAVTRINHAEMELRSTSKNITQIAMECGYNNIAYFSATYKKLKGVSPTEARENSTVNKKNA